MWLCCHAPTPSGRGSYEPSISSGIEHHFAEEIGAFEQVMRCRSLRQGKASVNDWAHAPQRHEAYEGPHILRATTAHTHDVEGADKDLPQVQLHPVAGRDATGHQPTILLQAAETRVPDRGSHVFDNDVHPLAGSQFSHACHDVLGVVVDHIVSADLARFLEFVVRAGSGNDPGAHGLGDLHGVTAYATAGGHDQHVLAWPDMSPVDEHLIGREPGSG